MGAKTGKSHASRPSPGQPAYQLLNFGMKLSKVILRIIPCQPNKNSLKIHMLKPESLSTKAQREDGSTFSSILSSKPETDFLENIHPLIIMSVQRRAEKSQSRAARPLPRLPACENAFALDLFTLTSGSNHEVGDWQKSQAGRPRGGRPAPNCLISGQSFYTDFIMQSGTYTRKARIISIMAYLMQVRH